MLCIRMIEVTNHFFTAQPLEISGVDDDIGGMCAASEFATARAMAVLKDIFGPVKLVSDSLAKAATFRGFTHGTNLLLRRSVAQVFVRQQIRCQQFDDFMQGFIDQVLLE